MEIYNVKLGKTLYTNSISFYGKTLLESDFHILIFLIINPLGGEKAS